MKRGGRSILWLMGGLAAVVTAFTLPAAAAAPPLEQRLAAVKQSLVESQAAIRGYEWVETTVISVKGEEKSRTMQRCYYGADGVLQRTPLPGEKQADGPGGLRGKIAERKKEALTDYMQEAVELVHRYVPLDPALMQTSREAGNLSLTEIDPGRRVRFDFKFYRLPGDAVGLTFNVTDNTLAGLDVSTFLGKEKDPVSLRVDFGTMDGRITYTRNTVLEAKAKGLSVTVTNSGFLKLAR
jgi:hypothetical protein